VCCLWRGLLPHTQTLVVVVDADWTMMKVTTRKKVAVVMVVVCGYLWSRAAVAT